jgi:transposase
LRLAARPPFKPRPVTTQPNPTTVLFSGLLVEAAWHHRVPYRASLALQQRWQLAPPLARARGDAGNRRLHARWVAFNLRRKRPVIANVAIARELAGWCWSLAVMD